MRNLENLEEKDEEKRRNLTGTNKTKPFGTQTMQG